MINNINSTPSTVLKSEKRKKHSELINLHLETICALRNMYNGLSISEQLYLYRTQKRKWHLQIYFKHKLTADIPYILCHCKFLADKLRRLSPSVELGGSHLIDEKLKPKGAKIFLAPT